MGMSEWLKGLRQPWSELRRPPREFPFQATPHFGWCRCRTKSRFCGLERSEFQGFGACLIRSWSVAYWVQRMSLCLQWKFNHQLWKLSIFSWGTWIIRLRIRLHFLAIFLFLSKIILPRLLQSCCSREQIFARGSHHLISKDYSKNHDILSKSNIIHKTSTRPCSGSRLLFRKKSTLTEK